MYSCGKAHCSCCCIGDQCWRIFLLVLNVIFTTLAVVMIVYLSAAYGGGAGNPLISEAYFGSQLAFLIIVGAIAVMGATCISEKVSGQGRASMAMYLYFGVTMTVFIAELVLVILSLEIALSAKAAENQAYNSNGFIDHDVESWARAHSSLWYSSQTYMGCCGYSNTTGPLATGFLCSNPSLLLQTCRHEVLRLASSRFATIGAIGTVVVFLQLLGCLAATCLACYMKPPGSVDDSSSERKTLMQSSGDTDHL